MNLYQEYIFKSHYARGNETYDDSIYRVVDFLKKNISHPHLLKDMDNILCAQEIVPSMRLLATAGPAAARDHASIYNCAYIELDDIINDFCEVMYLLTCGCGIGFGLFREKYISFPREFIYNPDYPCVIEDDRIGWCNALYHTIYSLKRGYIPKFDYSNIRPKGSPLITFGGYASGPEVLEQLIDYIVCVAMDNSYLSALNVLDIMCKIAEAIQCGGTRRSAMICLTNIKEVAYAKSMPDWPSHRRFVNISYTYDKKPSKEEFDIIWKNYKNGEPGIFNREAAKKRTGIENPGINPCGEIIMRSKQFCNLTEVICRVNDSIQDICLKARYATLLGLCQGKLNNFRYLSSDWNCNAEYYPIIGCSLTGIHDCPAILNASSDELKLIKKACYDEVNMVWKLLDYKSKPARITCIKPSGTVSQLMDCSAGIHPRPSKYYIRNVLQCRESPLANFMIKNGFPYFDDPNNKDNVIFSFPCKSPNDVKDVSTEEQIQLYLKFMKHYVDHNVSNTVFVKDWDTTGNLIYQNFDNIVGMAFFPKIDSSELKKIYKYLPEQPCTKDEYDSIKMPTNIEWPIIKNKETVYECSGTSCKIKDI